MNAVVFFAKLELVVIMAAIGAYVGLGILTRRIHVRGLLAARPGQPVSPERVQALLLSVGAVGYLFLSLGAHTAQGLTFPSQGLLALFGGSQAAYLITKYMRPRAASSPSDRR